MIDCPISAQEVQVPLAFYVPGIYALSSRQDNRKWRIVVGTIAILTVNVLQYFAAVSARSAGVSIQANVASASNSPALPVVAKKRTPPQSARQLQPASKNAKLHKPVATRSAKPFAQLPRFVTFWNQDKHLFSKPNTNLCALTPTAKHTSPLLISMLVSQHVMISSESAHGQLARQPRVGAIDRESALLQPDLNRNHLGSPLRTLNISVSHCKFLVGYCRKRCAIEKDGGPQLLHRAVRRRQTLTGRQGSVSCASTACRAQTCDSCSCFFEQPV